MHHSLISLFSSLVLISPLCLAEGDNFLECSEEVLCGSEENRRRSMQCVSQLSQKDLDLMFELLNRRYPDAKDLREVFDEGCKDTQKFKVNGQTAEESAKTVASRACLSLMVGECQVRKAMMGVFGK